MQSQTAFYLNCLQDVKLSRIAIYRDEFGRMNCGLNRSFISCGELHCDSVKIKTVINPSLFFLRQCESLYWSDCLVVLLLSATHFRKSGHARLIRGCFSFSQCFRAGGFLFSLPAPSPLPLTRPISSFLQEVSTWRFREQIANPKKTPALQATNSHEKLAFNRTTTITAPRTTNRSRRTYNKVHRQPISNIFPLALAAILDK